MEKAIYCFLTDKNIFKGNSLIYPRLYCKEYEKICPDYKITFWDRNNEEFKKLLDKSKFLKESYKRRVWPYVLDYMKVYFLYNFGGIVLNSRVKLLKNLDEFLDNDLFFSFEGDVNPNLFNFSTYVIGAKPNHPIIKKVLDLYNSDEIFYKENMDLNSLLYEYISSDIDFLEFRNRKLVDIKNGIENKEIYKNDNLKYTVYPINYLFPKFDGSKDYIYDETVVIGTADIYKQLLISQKDIIQLKSGRYTNVFKKEIYKLKENYKYLLKAIINE